MKVYLDNAATTRMDKEVFDAMLPYLRDEYGNPSSMHDLGQKARAAVEDARAKVAALINAKPAEIIFTSSGTEANNFAVKGAAYAGKRKGNHIIVSSIEHFSVLYSVRMLAKDGYEVTYLPVDKYGMVNPDDVTAAIKDKTVLISVMHANNEVGTIQPIAEIAKIAKSKGIPFHTDAVSTAGSIEADVEKMGVDTLTLAANQFYGPKGAAALYIRSKTRIVPLLHGGVQEEGRRAGTEDVASIVGMGAAAEIALKGMAKNSAYTTKLRDKLIDALKTKIPNIYLNGHAVDRIPGNINICVEFIEGESMLLFLNMEGISASSGSSCTSKALKASHVLTAMGVDAALANGSLLLSLGKNNTEEEIDYVIEKLPPIVERLRKMSPLYKKP
ncbi:MAG: cysteine desulfurase NifS [Candidatus Omnitrophica bacterium CG1_02_49_10]|nr:MAG: cysteine desulfurase NifS [Candidatus Omnitrophica bacterium CG1_02_49_10]